jgi:hypothetical protein
VPTAPKTSKNATMNDIMRVAIRLHFVIIFPLSHVDFCRFQPYTYFSICLYLLQRQEKSVYDLVLDISCRCFYIQYIV